MKKVKSMSTEDRFNQPTKPPSGDSTECRRHMQKNIHSNHHTKEVVGHWLGHLALKIPDLLELLDLRLIEEGKHVFPSLLFFHRCNKDIFNVLIIYEWLNIHCWLTKYINVCYMYIWSVRYSMHMYYMAVFFHAHLVSIFLLIVFSKCVLC